jgi:hypothetical protein
MALFDPNDFRPSGGWLPFEDRWAPVDEAIDKTGQFDPQGANNLPPRGYPAMTNAQMFPGYGTNMGQGDAAGGLQPPPPILPPQGGQGMPPQAYAPPPIVMPTLGGMAPQGRSPDVGDRLQAAGAGFFNAGSPMQAIGNLLGGLFTGQRQDPMGLAVQASGQKQVAEKAEQGQFYGALRESGVPHSEAVGMVLNPVAMNQWRQNQLKARELDLKEKDFKVVPYGAAAINNKGEVVFKGALDGEGLLDEATVKTMAEQARAGDTSVFQNLGRGAQGAQNIIRLRAEIARQNAETGTSGTTQAMKNAEFFGTKAGQRTLATKQTNIELAATEFKQVLPVVQKASLEVNRTQYPDLNKIYQAWLEKTGDPKVVAFGGGINTLVNLYARAISPTGVPTVSDKDHAREILNKAWSQGQFDSAVKMMSAEIDAALESPGVVRDHMRKRFDEGMQPAKPNAAPSNNGWSIKRLP